MKMSEVLLIKLDTNGFERFYNRKMQECGCTVLPVCDFRREKYGLSVLRPLQLRQLFGGGHCRLQGGGRL